MRKITSPPSALTPYVLLENLDETNFSILFLMSRDEAGSSANVAIVAPKARRGDYQQTVQSAAAPLYSLLSFS